MEFSPLVDKMRRVTSTNKLPDLMEYLNQGNVPLRHLLNAIFKEVIDWIVIQSCTSFAFER